MSFERFEKTVTVTMLRCRCSNEWQPRKDEPLACPGCGWSPSLRGKADYDWRIKDDS